GNAHPHIVGPIALVHNGIIENFKNLRDELIAEGRTFESETDTEVVGHLIAREVERGASPQDAVAMVLPRLVGACALAFVFPATPVEKGNYAHYMQKEIFEQPIVVAQTLQTYVRPFEGEVALPVADADLEQINRLTIVACGTSYYAGLVAKYWVEQFARVPVDVDVASEFRYREPVLEPGGLALFISQSGETADTLAALRHARSPKQRIAVVVNVPTSSMAREADLLLPTHAGPEIGVASTKAFTRQLAVL